MKHLIFTDDTINKITTHVPFSLTLLSKIAFIICKDEIKPSIHNNKQIWLYNKWNWLYIENTDECINYVKWKLLFIYATINEYYENKLKSQYDISKIYEQHFTELEYNYDDSNDLSIYDVLMLKRSWQALTNIKNKDFMDNLMNIMSQYYDNPSLLL